MEIKKKYFDRNVTWKINGMHKPKVCKICFIFWGNSIEMKEHKHRVHAY